MATYYFDIREFDPELYTCRICSKLLEDPVTMPCGHHFCCGCATRHWDGQDDNRKYTCPQCKDKFDPRPVLVRNNNIVENMKMLQLNEEGKCFAGPGDVPCDLCYWRKKERAVHSCLSCFLSYCASHIIMHTMRFSQKNHKLVMPRADLHEEKDCLVHLEPLTMYCVTDSHLICQGCAVTEHGGHKVTTAKDEMEERIRWILLEMAGVDQRLQYSKEEAESMTLLLISLEASLEAELGTCKRFDHVSYLLTKRLFHIENELREQQDVIKNQVQKLQNNLEQELSELKRQQAELDSLSVEDPEQFLLKYKHLSELQDQSSSTARFPDFTVFAGFTGFTDFTEALSDLTDKLQTCTNMGLALTQNKLLLQQPTTREQYLQYSINITLDPNTAHRRLVLSKGNRRVTVVKEDQDYPPHPDRFSHHWQALSTEMLKEQSYFEVECGDKCSILGFAYKRIPREKDVKESSIGCNNVSWALKTGMSNHICHNAGEMQVRNTRQCEKIGVFVDHPAGLVSFYGISPKDMFLCGQFHAAFTEPLYVAVGFFSCDMFLEFGKLK